MLNIFQQTISSEKITRNDKFFNLIGNLITMLLVTLYAIVFIPLGFIWNFAMAILKFFLDCIDTVDTAVNGIVSYYYGDFGYTFIDHRIKKTIKKPN